MGHMVRGLITSPSDKFNAVWAAALSVGSVHVRTDRENELSYIVDSDDEADLKAKLEIAQSTAQPLPADGGSL